MVGGRELPREPVQPRGAGRAAAGLVVQAVRARDGAEARASRRRRRSSRSRCRSSSANKYWYVAQLRGRVPRADRPREGDLGVRQLRLRAADEGRRADERRAHGARGSGSRARSTAYFSIGLGARGREPARDGARVRDVRERRLPRRRRRSSGTSRARSRRSTTRPARSRSRTRRAARACCRSSRRALVDAAAPGRRHERAPATRAALPDQAVAGKTGTTENYGDAWFVGYTPQLVDRGLGRLPERAAADADASTTARPVAGGTFPAQIWKTFMESALADDRARSRRASRRRRTSRS